MWLERVQLQLQVPQVPQSHSLKIKVVSFHWFKTLYKQDKISTDPWTAMCCVTGVQKADPLYLLSQWPVWTRCRDWRTGSWPQRCGRPLHGWAWRCCWTACPNCSKTKGTIVREKVETEQQLCFSQVISEVSKYCCQVENILHHEFLVIGNRSKEWLMEQVPGDVLHHSSVACEDCLGVNNFSLLGHCADVPQAYSL